MRVWAAILVSASIIAGGCHLIGDVTDVNFAEAQGGAGGLSSSSGSGGSDGGDGPVSSSSSGEPCVVEECPQGAPCAPAVCDMGSCSFLPLPPNAPCDGMEGYCTSDGQCVDCTQSSHCNQGAGEICVSDACVTAGCSDTVLNNGESDVDCGGPNCGPCPHGSACEGDDDCQSTICSQSVCQPCMAQRDCTGLIDYCDPSNGNCRQKKGIFSGCDEDYECLSNNCFIGTCGL